MNIITIATNCENKTRGELGLNKSGHWCAEFASYVINNSDINENAKTVTSISCTAMQSNMSKSEYWSEPEDDIKAGDIIFYNWNHDYDSTGNLDHVGIVVEVHDDYIITIEGNTVGNCEPTAPVKRKTRYRNQLNFNCKYPDYYMRYVDCNKPTENYNNKVLTDNDFIKELSTLIKKYPELFS